MAAKTEDLAESFARYRKPLSVSKPFIESPVERSEFVVEDERSTVTKSNSLKDPFFSLKKESSEVHEVVLDALKLKEEMQAHQKFQQKKNYQKNLKSFTGEKKGLGLLFDLEE